MMDWQLFNIAARIQPLAEEECNLLVTGRGPGFLRGFASNSCAATTWGVSEGQEMCSQE